MKKLSIGIVGLGRLGIVHARNIAFNIPNAELVAACCRTPEKLEKAKAELGITNVFTDYDEMLKMPGLDAVAIISSSGSHCEQIEKALNAGKHVFCEKPLGVTVEECEQTEKAVKAHPELTFMLGFMRRFDESYAYAKKKIEEGAIGTPYLFKGTAMDPEAVIQSCIQYSSSSAGIFLDLAIHDIDLIRWYLGSEITEVHAMGATFKYPQLHENGDDETGIAMYKLANGALAMLHVGRSAPHGYHIETEIVGTKGTIRISPVPEKNLAVIYDNRGVVQECIEDFPERFKDAYLNEMTEFVNCVLSGKPSTATAHDGTLSVKAAYATKQSWRSGEIVKID